MVCHQICVRHKANKPRSGLGGRYFNGQKRCQMCDIFMHWEGQFCPCCGYRLRNGPRGGDLKKILRKKLAERNGKSKKK